MITTTITQGTGNPQNAHYAKAREVKMKINNLTIRYKDGKYQVVTPDRRVWEEFTEVLNAVKFAMNTRDFVRAK